MIPLNIVIGNRELSAWQPARGVTWVQTRLPKHAERMAKRQNSKLVLWAVTGGYLKTYEFSHRLAWAEGLIARYTSPNAQVNATTSPNGAPEPERGTV